MRWKSLYFPPSLTLSTTFLMFAVPWITATLTGIPATGIVASRTLAALFQQGSASASAYVIRYDLPSHALEVDLFFRQLLASDHRVRCTKSGFENTARGAEQRSSARSLAEGVVEVCFWEGGERDLKWQKVSETRSIFRRTNYNLLVLFQSSDQSRA